MDAGTIAALTELVKALAPVVASVAAAATSYLAWRKGSQNAGAIATVDGKINGRMDQLLQLAQEAAELRGNATGRAAQLAEHHGSAAVQRAGKGSERHES